VAILGANVPVAKSQVYSVGTVRIHIHGSMGRNDMKDKLRVKLLDLIAKGEPLPQPLVDQWNKLTSSFI
jgi:hypothetical protein